MREDLSKIFDNWINIFLCRKENVVEKAKQQKNGETDATISERCGISLRPTISK